MVQLLKKNPTMKGLSLNSLNAKRHLSSVELCNHIALLGSLVALQKQ